MLEQTLKPVRLTALMVPQELAKDKHTRDLQNSAWLYQIGRFTQPSTNSDRMGRTRQRVRIHRTFWGPDRSEARHDSIHPTTSSRGFQVAVQRVYNNSTSDNLATYRWFGNAAAKGRVETHGGTPPSILRTSEPCIVSVIHTFFTVPFCRDRRTVPVPSIEVVLVLTMLLAHRPVDEEQRPSS